MNPFIEELEFRLRILATIPGQYSKYSIPSDKREDLSSLRRSYVSDVYNIICVFKDPYFNRYYANKIPEPMKNKTAVFRSSLLDKLERIHKDLNTRSDPSYLIELLMDISDIAKEILDFISKFNNIATPEHDKNE